MKKKSTLNSTETNFYLDVSDDDDVVGKEEPTKEETENQICIQLNPSTLRNINSNNNNNNANDDIEEKDTVPDDVFHSS